MPILSGSRLGLAKSSPLSVRVGWAKCDAPGTRGFPPPLSMPSTICARRFAMSCIQTMTTSTETKLASFYLRHGVNTILFPGDMTPSTNKLIRHHVIHTNCCRGRPVMGDTKVVLLKLGYEDRRSGLKDCRNMPDLIVMVSIFLVITSTNPDPET